MKRIYCILCSLLFPIFVVMSNDINALASENINLTDLKPLSWVDENNLFNGDKIINNTSKEVYYYANEFLYGFTIQFMGEYSEGRTALGVNESYEVGRDMKCTGNPFYVMPTPPVDPVSKSAPAHTHDFVEGEIYSATQTTDGLEGIYCKSCGAIKESWSISAYGYSINDYATPMVNASKAGQNVTFELGEWNSFPKAFMEKIAAKSAEGVTFVFHYKWNHVKQEITIPAGTQVDLNYDWYGPAKMAELYGAN